MIAYVEGVPVDAGEDYVIIAVGGLGYRIFVAANRLPAIMAAESVRLYTYMAVREDSITLYGLETSRQLAAFRSLVSVSGVGPRLALAVLSTWPVERLADIVGSEDYAALATVSGIGKKTAQRMVLELKDKLAGGGPAAAPSGAVADARAALVSLGYRSAEVLPLLQALAREGHEDTEELVRLALARLSRGGGD